MTATPLTAPARIRVWDGEEDSTFGHFVRGTATTAEEAESLVIGMTTYRLAAHETVLTQIDSRIGDDTVEETVWLVMVKRDAE
jgi:hypothetical protein